MKFYLSKTPNIIRPLAKDLIWSLPTETPSLFLTFDDGPIPEVTPLVCSILKKYNAKATFFCVGDNVKKNPEVYQQILDEGHSVGNHTFNHLSGWKTQNYRYYRNTLKASELIDSKLFRPPYGRITRMQSKAIHKKYDIIMWDVLSGDFIKEINGQKCAQLVIKNAVEGSIVVMHDSIKAGHTMLDALPKILDHFSALNYTFKAIPMTGINSK